MARERRAGAGHADAVVASGVKEERDQACIRNCNQPLSAGGETCARISHIRDPIAGDVVGDEKSYQIIGHFRRGR